MKTVWKRLMLPLIVLLAGTALLACSALDGLPAFLTAAGRTVESAEALDDVADTDLADSNAAGLDVALPLSFELLEEGVLSPAEKIALLRTLRQEIRTTHAAIVAKRAEVRTAFTDLKAAVQVFRDAGLTLTEEQKTRLAGLREELSAITADLRASVGQAYRKMADLRGKYNVENLDLLLSVHQEVAAELTMRLEKLERIGEILQEVSLMVAPGE